MKNNILLEISRMKFIENYKRGVVISEQKDVLYHLSGFKPIRVSNGKLYIEETEGKQKGLNGKLTEFKVNPKNIGPNNPNPNPDIDNDFLVNMNYITKYWNTIPQDYKPKGGISGAYKFLGVDPLTNIPKIYVVSVGTDSITNLKRDRITESTDGFMTMFTYVKKGMNGLYLTYHEGNPLPIVS